MSYEVLETAAPAPAAHRCARPGLFARRRRGLKLGAIIRCTECGSKFLWTLESSWADSYRTWVRL